MLAIAGALTVVAALILCAISVADQCDKEIIAWIARRTPEVK